MDLKFWERELDYRMHEDPTADLSEERAEIKKRRDEILTEEFISKNANYMKAKKALDDLLAAQAKRLEAERIAAEQEAARERAEEIVRE